MVFDNRKIFYYFLFVMSSEAYYDTFSAKYKNLYINFQPKIPLLVLCLNSHLAFMSLQSLKKYMRNALLG